MTDVQHKDEAALRVAKSIVAGALLWRLANNQNAGNLAESDVIRSYATNKKARHHLGRGCWKGIGGQEQQRLRTTRTSKEGLVRVWLVVAELSIVRVGPDQK
jgi:hypothetical protein